MTNDKEQRQTKHYSGTGNINSPNAPEQAPNKSSRARGVVILLIAVIVVATLVITGIVPRLRASKALAAETNALAAPTVLVVPAETGTPNPRRRFCCPAIFKPSSIRRSMPEQTDTSNTGISTSGHASNKDSFWLILILPRWINSYPRLRPILERRWRMFISLNSRQAASPT